MSRGNIIKLYISAFFSNMVFDRAIWALYLVKRGLSIAQIGIAESLLHLAIFLFEIPTGMIADIYGKRLSIIISRLLVIIYALGMIYFDKYYLFLGIFILLGLSETFISGADTALLYESIKEKGEIKEKIFIKANSIYGSFTVAGLSIGMFVGGLLQVVSWKVVYAGIITVQLLSIVPLLTIKEDSMLGSKNETISNWVKMKELIYDTKAVFSKPTFLILTAGIVLFTASTNVIYLFIPIWFKEIGFNETWISIVFAIDAVMGIIVYSSVSKLESKFHINYLMLVPPIVVLLCLIVIPYVPRFIALASFLVLNNSTRIFYPLSDALVNSAVASKQRATVLSTVSFINSLLIMILFPGLGLIVKFIDMGTAMLLFATFPLVSIVFLTQFNSSMFPQKASAR